MTTEPFKLGEKVWVGNWRAGEYQRLWTGTVASIGPAFVHVKEHPSDNSTTLCNPENLERIHNDLNERLK